MAPGSPRVHERVGDWLPLRWLILAHVLAAFLFVLMHGPSIAAMLRLRTERDLAAVRALLDTSRAWSQSSWGAWSFLALTGLLLALVEHTWRLPWVWGSALLLILVTGAMSPLAAAAFNEARAAAGLPYFNGRRMQPAAPPDEPALRVALARIRARSGPVAIVGTAGLVLLVWLMVAKPG